MYKKYLIITVVLLFGMNLYSKEVKLNCLIFVDWKLPYYKMNGKLIYFDSLQQKKEIPFSYQTGDLIIEGEYAEAIEALHDSVPLKMVLKYIEYDKNYNQTEYIYEIDFSHKWKLFYNNYIIFKIINLDKKKRTYDIGFTSNNVSRNWYTKDDERIFQKIHFK